MWVYNQRKCSKKGQKSEIENQRKSDKKKYRRIISQIPWTCHAVGRKGSWTSGTRGIASWFRHQNQQRGGWVSEKKKPANKYLKSKSKSKSNQTLTSSSNQHISCAANWTIITSSIVAPPSLTTACSISTHTAVAHTVIAVWAHTWNKQTNKRTQHSSEKYRRRSKSEEGNEILYVPEQLVP